MTIKKQFFLLIAITVVFVLIGCGSSPKAAAGSKAHGTPAFVSHPPEDKAMIFGIGGERKANARQLIQNADNRAVQDIMGQLDYVVQEMIADYSLTAGIDGSPDVSAFQKAVGQVLRNAKFADMHLVRREQAKDKTMYSLVVIKKADALPQIVNILETEASRFAQFKNVYFYRELEKRLNETRMRPTILLK
jgi:hypothetical protein